MSKRYADSIRTPVDPETNVIESQDGEPLGTIDATRKILVERQALRDEERRNRRIARFRRSVSGAFTRIRRLRFSRSPRAGDAKPPDSTEPPTERADLLGSLRLFNEHVLKLARTQPMWSFAACLTLGVLLTALCLPYIPYGPSPLSGAHIPPLEPMTRAQLHVKAHSDPLELEDTMIPAPAAESIATTAAPFDEVSTAPAESGSREVRETFVVQVGSFLDPLNAERLADSLREQSLSVDVLLVENFHTVRVGPFREKGAADRTAASLEGSTRLTPLVIESSVRQATAPLVD